MMAMTTSSSIRVKPRAEARGIRLNGRPVGKVGVKDMKSRSGLLLVVAATLAVAYVAFFTDWFRSEPIRLSHRFFAANRGGPAVAPRVVFYVVPKQPIASLKILRAEDATATAAKPLWHLVADKAKPVPVEALAYGEAVPGMKPFVAGFPPGPLMPGAEYLLIVEADKKRGELRFTVPGK